MRKASSKTPPGVSPAATDLRREAMRKCWGVLVVFLLFGCAANKQRVVTLLRPSPPPVMGEEIAVEADGMAYMGDEDTLTKVRKRAREDAFRKLLEKGARIYLETRKERSFGVLTEDGVRQVMAGVMREVETLSEGLKGNTYRVRLRARVAPGDITWLLKKKREEAPKRPSKPPGEMPSVGPASCRVCLYQFTEAYLAGAFSVMVKAPGVKRVKRLSGTPEGVVCYRLYGDAAVPLDELLDELEDYLRRAFRISGVEAFRICTDLASCALDLYFDAGFN